MLYNFSGDNKANVEESCKIIGKKFHLIVLTFPHRQSGDGEMEKGFVRASLSRLSFISAIKIRKTFRRAGFVFKSESKKETIVKIMKSTAEKQKSEETWRLH